MSLIDDVARATVRIEFGASRGSGFHFVAADVIATNHHVVEGAEKLGPGAVVAVTESGDKLPLKLLAWSEKSKSDFALFRITVPVPAGRHVLRPNVLAPPARGLPLLFSGFPHGIPHLLVHHASVAGYVSSSAFYLEASVNGGNSGGPIVDASDGSVIGVVTQRRFLGGADLHALADSAEQLRMHCRGIAGRGSVQIMGVDFGKFSQLMAEGMLLIRQSLEANANSGIGIGFSIEPLQAQAVELGIV